MPIAVAEDKEYKKRQEAMKKRLEKLGVGNPVVKEAIKKQDSEKNEKLHEKFAVVDELVSAARGKFREDGNFKACVSSLAEALGKLATGKESAGLDKVESKGENNNSADENQETLDT